MRAERIFLLILVVVMAVGINQYFGSPISMRGLDMNKGQILIAYAMCAQEEGLPLKRHGYPPIEGAPLETLNMKQRNVVLGCALGSGSYNFVRWALQKPPHGQMFSLDERFGTTWPVALVVHWRDGRAAADTLRLILRRNSDKVWPINSTASLMVGLYEAQTVAAADYLANYNSSLLNEDNSLLFDQKDYPKYKGLTLAQYHAYRGRIKVADYYAGKGSRLAIPGKNFRHWLYENEQDKDVLFNAGLDDLLTRHGVPIDDRDAQGHTVLYLAVAKHDGKYAHWLLQQGANANVADVNGDTPLMAAAREDQRAIALDLLAHAADPNARDHQGETSLHIALSAKAWDVATALLGKHARVDIPDNLGRVAVFDCVENGCPLLDRLVQAGADFSIHDKNGNSPLHAAASVAGMQDDVANALIAHGAPINLKNADGRTALHIAVSQNNTALVSLLLSKGAQVNAADNLGNTPLHLAQTPEMVQVLLEAGANPDLPNKAGIMPVNGTVARTLMLFHSPAQAQSNEDTLPRYFASILVGDDALSGLTLSSASEGVINTLVQGEDGTLSTETVNFMPRNAALEFRVQQACETGAELRVGGSTLELPHLGIYSRWQVLAPAAGTPTAYAASIPSGTCAPQAVTSENIMQHARQAQPEAAGKWRAAALLCITGRGQGSCRLFVRPALRVQVKNGKQWREAGILHTGT